MKVTAIFKETHVLVNCGRGAMAVRHFISKAVRQYVGELFKDGKSATINVKYVLSHNALLDGNDKVADVLNDGDYVTVTFEEPCGEKKPTLDAYSSGESRQARENRNSKSSVSNRKRCAADVEPAAAAKRMKVQKMTESDEQSSESAEDVDYFDTPGWYPSDFKADRGELVMARQLLLKLRDGGRDPVDTIRLWAKTNRASLREIPRVSVYAFTKVDPQLTPMEALWWQRKAGYYNDGFYTKEEAQEP